MKKIQWLALILLLVCGLAFSACDDGGQQQGTNDEATPPSQSDQTDHTTESENHTHIHAFGDWITVREATCTEQGEQTRSCSCGESESQSISLTVYTATELSRQSSTYVGEIHTYDKNGTEYAQGTGFVLSDDGKIITNYHVIEGAYSAEITLNNTKYHIESVLAYDVNIDLAILKIHASGLTAANVCKQPVTVEETVYAIGASKGITSTCAQGRITQVDKTGSGVSYIRHDAPITNGDSGGPLLNAYGEVIGILTYGASDTQNLNLAIFAEEIDNLVCGTPVTFAELFHEALSPYQILQDWLIEHQTREDSGMICYDYWQNTTRYTLGYESQADQMCLLVDNGKFSLRLDLAGDPSAYSYTWDWTLTNPDDYYKVVGTIHAYTYTITTKLTNYAYTSGVYLEEAKIVPMAQTTISLSIAFLEKLLQTNAEMELTIQDFGFLAFD